MRSEAVKKSRFAGEQIAFALKQFDDSSSLGDELLDSVDTLADRCDEIGVCLIDPHVVRGSLTVQIRAYGIELISLFLQARQDHPSSC